MNNDMIRDVAWAIVRYELAEKGVDASGWPPAVVEAAKDQAVETYGGMARAAADAVIKAQNVA